MKYLLIAVAVLFAAGYVLWQYGKRPLRHRLTAGGDFSRFLQVLLYRGFDRGYLVIETRGGRRFVQFSKYIRSRRNVGLRFDFPRAPWSEAYFETLRGLLEGHGFEYDVRRAEPAEAAAARPPVSEFVVVDLKQDLEAAARLTRLALLEVFKLGPDEPITLFFVNVSPREERIGF